MGALYDFSLFRNAVLILLGMTIPVLQVQALDDKLLTGDDFSAVEDFTLIDDRSDDIQVEEIDNTLVQVRSFTIENKRYIRYTQYYKGLEVVGRSVVGHFEGGGDKLSYEKASFSGKIARKIKLPIDESSLSDQFRDSMAAFAQDDFYKRVGLKGQIEDLDTQAVIWIDKDEKARLAYKVSFRVLPDSGQQAWPHYLINAENSEIFQYWNNIQGLYNDHGPGGNNKTGPYTFGRGGVPPLSVTKSNNVCSLINSHVRVVSLNNTWTTTSNLPPISYICGQNTGNQSNGAQSPGNDAYVFSNLVLAMYRDWYQSPVLTWSNGNVRQLVVLVNAGRNYENAYWDGNYLVFGDGAYSFHPLVSVTLMAHEMSHAFTGDHSGLYYANQSGAINEAFSDMSAIAAEYYLKQQSASAYQSVIGTTGIDWRIGDRISKGSFAMRAMDNPSAYSSAECEEVVSGCQRSWADVISASQQITLSKRQSYIVHKGSGVMNRAFVNIVNELNGNVRAAFALMVRSNMLYWTTTSTFSEAACGVVQAAQVDGIDGQIITRSFRQVGVTPAC